MSNKIQVNDVVNVKVSSLRQNGFTDFQHWNKNKNNIYIGRDMSFYVDGTTKSKWHNPYAVCKKNKIYKNASNRYSLDESLKLYQSYIESTPGLINDLHELNGKTLGCWCKPNKCHGDVLSKLVIKYCN